MLDIKFGSILVTSEDGQRALLITRSSYKGQEDYRVLQGNLAVTHTGFAYSDTRYYHDTLEQALNYHEYYLSNVKTNIENPSKT